MYKALLTIGIALLGSSLAAQPKTAPLDVAVKHVNDRRTSGKFFNRLEITVELPKMKSSDVTASRVLVASAVDDTGQNLIDPEASEPQLEGNMRMGMGGDEPQGATVTVTLANPARKAKTIREVRGEIELYMPGKDPNSVADVPKFLSTSGKMLSHRALKANGVEITLVSPAQLEAERKKLVDAKRKEAKDSGWEGESMEQYIASYQESLLKLDEGEAFVRIKDPNKRIQEITYVDAAGEVKRASTGSDETLTRLSVWGEKPSPDWGLRISMKTPKNLVRHPFVLANVALP